jgi:hypothetical protein
MPTAILTTLGKSLIRTAAGDGSQVAISHVALGDGLGALYTPTKAQTGLRRELVRKPIDRRSALGDDSWRIVCEFAPETPAFQIREMGFFSEGGQLIAIWAGLDIDPRQTGVITYIVDFILNFSDLDGGLLIINAPDDELFDFALSTLRGQAAQDRAIFKIKEKLK